MAGQLWAARTWLIPMAGMNEPLGKTECSWLVDWGWSRSSLWSNAEAGWHVPAAMAGRESLWQVFSKYTFAFLVGPSCLLVEDHKTHDNSEHAHRIQ